MPVAVCQMARSQLFLQRKCTGGCRQTVFRCRLISQTPHHPFDITVVFGFVIFIQIDAV